MKPQPRATKFTRRGGPAVAHLILVRSMPRTLLIIAALLSVAITAHPTVDICTPLTRETFNGPWEGLFFMGTHVTLFHLAIAADDHDSYLSEMDPDSLKGTVFRMDACTITEGKVKLHFKSLWPVADGRGWWFEGEGCSGDRGVIWANFGTDLTEVSKGVGSRKGSVLTIDTRYSLLRRFET